MRNGVFAARLYVAVKDLGEKRQEFWCHIWVGWINSDDEIHQTTCLGYINYADWEIR